MAQWMAGTGWLTRSIVLVLVVLNNGLMSVAQQHSDDGEAVVSKQTCRDLIAEQHPNGVAAINTMRAALDRVTTWFWNPSSKTTYSTAVTLDPSRRIATILESNPQGLVLSVPSAAEESLDGTCDPASTIVYELFEPVDLELGTAPSIEHPHDFAYQPVKNAVSIPEPPRSWWQWWAPMYRRPSYSEYQFTEHFAGGSHGEIWRGCRRGQRNVPLIFKRLRVEKGYHILEAGLREVYFGNRWVELRTDLFTEYVEHFFGDRNELWIVFQDAGASLRSFLYNSVETGDYVFYQHSWLWNQIRLSLKRKSDRAIAPPNADEAKLSQPPYVEEEHTSGQEVLASLLQQILQAVAFLHENEVIHRDIKPSNVMCKSNVDSLSPEKIQSFRLQDFKIKCVLGDFSSGYDSFTSQNFYSSGPSRSEQTDEYAPPEAIFGTTYRLAKLDPSFDSWSIGVLILELLLGTPNVFSVDQRTRTILTHKLSKEGANQDEIDRALYLAALSQFCIYNPSNETKPKWPLRSGDPLHRSAMTKQSCSLTDFHHALRARDPLGWGFETSDKLLHLIWRLLAWDPENRILPSEALRHPFFLQVDTPGVHGLSESDVAIESQMLDPQVDFNASNVVEKFICPKCKREFKDWQSCYNHANARKHGRFCQYDTSKLPSCLNTHAMLPAHASSGHCDIQGRRRTIEDFHSIHLETSKQFYSIFDGHLGNLASKFAASLLYEELSGRITEASGPESGPNWRTQVKESAREAFNALHDRFMQAIQRASFMDQSGTTATALLVMESFYVIVSLGDTRAVIAKRINDTLVPLQLTHDHVAADATERELVEQRGGTVEFRNNVHRVNGILTITRSIGDEKLAHVLSREPHVIVMTRDEMKDLCGNVPIDDDTRSPCFIVLASDGLWDVLSNEDTVELVDAVVAPPTSTGRNTTAFQQASEALVHEAYVRGTTDNVGVCLVAIE